MREPAEPDQPAGDWGRLVIAEAVDAAIAVGRAPLVRVALMAAAATCALYTLVVAVACAVLAVRRGVVAVMSLVQHSSGAEMAREAHSAPEALHGPPSRTTPTWARKDAA
jgi:hypothetical protein